MSTTREHLAHWVAFEKPGDSVGAAVVAAVDYVAERIEMTQIPGGYRVVTKRDGRASVYIHQSPREIILKWFETEWKHLTA